MRALAVFALALSACASAPHADATPALAELRAARFAEAERAAAAVLAADARNGVAAAVRAVARYQGAMRQLVMDFMTVAEGAVRSRGVNHGYMRASLAATLAALDAVDADLAVAAADPGFALELCLACWEHDFNRNGRVDDSDRRLFQIEIDADGNELPEDDPRRKPTFRFDVGDVHWARAMVAFQAALVEIVLAYDWHDLDGLLGRGKETDRVVLKLADGKRMQRARERIVAGLDHAERARRAYLDETDDDREWVPSPRQKSHPLPLVVDDALYATWRDVLAGARDLIGGKTALSIAEIAQLGGHRWERPPGGYLDLGRWLSDPHDVVFELPALEHISRGDPASVERVLASVFGPAYVKTQQPTPLVRMLARMKGEVDRNEDTFARKLRYFLWLN